MDQLPRLGKRELICLLSFTCNYVVFVWRGFLFLWVLGMGYVILLWHSLSLPYNYFSVGFDPDQIRTLVSMATDSSRYNGKNGVITFPRMFLIGSFSYLQVTMTYLRAWMTSKFGRIRPWTTELPALERMKYPIDL